MRKVTSAPDRIILPIAAVDAGDGVQLRRDKVGTLAIKEDGSDVVHTEPQERSSRVRIQEKVSTRVSCTPSSLTFGYVSR